MATYTVRLIFHEELPETTVERLSRHEETFRSVLTTAGRTEVVVESAGDTLGEALTLAIAAVSAATSALVDSAEVLSERENLHRLGGPETLARFEQGLTSRRGGQAM